MAKEWLVRTSRNIILGPFSQEELQAMIFAGKVLAEDEVCESGSYWFALSHEGDRRTYFEMGAADMGDDRTDPAFPVRTSVVEPSQASPYQKMEVHGISVNAQPWRVWMQRFLIVGIVAVIGRVLYLRVYWGSR